MARAIRIEYPDALYHITARGNRRKRIFNDDRDHEKFLELLGEAVERFGWVLTTYVLMVNHFHLVLQTPQPNLSKGMQWLNARYAAYYNKRHGKVGHLFGERYKAIHVQSEEYLQRVVRYVVLNPVRANMVALPEDFRWSSYRAIAGLADAPRFLSIAPLIPYFGEPSSWRTNYIGYVREGIAKPDNIWRGLRRRIYLGTEEWLRLVGQKIKVKFRKGDIPLDQRAAGRPAMTRIVNKVAEAFEIKSKDLREKRGGIERGIAAWIGVYQGGRKLRVIAQALKLRSCSRVTQLVQEIERLMRTNRAWRERISALRFSFA